MPTRMSPRTQMMLENAMHSLEDARMNVEEAMSELNDDDDLGLGLVSENIAELIEELKDVPGSGMMSGGM